MFDLDDLSVPQKFRELVLADLRRACRIMRKIDDEIDPQFRVVTPEGDWGLVVTLPPPTGERVRYLSLVSDYMASKLAVGFTLAAELHAPSAMSCVGVARGETLLVIAPIVRKPLRFAQPVWLGAELVDDQIKGLLPRGARELSSERLEELRRWFGENGRFPALSIARSSRWL